MLPGPVEVVEDRQQRREHHAHRLLRHDPAVALDPLAVVGVLGGDPLQIPQALVEFGAQRLEFRSERAGGRRGRALRRASDRFDAGAIGIRRSRHWRSHHPWRRPVWCPPPSCAPAGRSGLAAGRVRDAACPAGPSGPPPRPGTPSPIALRAGGLRGTAGFGGTLAGRSVARARVASALAAEASESPRQPPRPEADRWYRSCACL